MVQNILIQNFKSIRNLELTGRRINVFIGEPNTGKSNILEALGLFALPYRGNINELVRNNDLSNLFFENDVSNKIEVKAGSCYYQLVFEHELINGLFQDSRHSDWTFRVGLQQRDLINPVLSQDYKIHPYYFKVLSKFELRFNEFLSPPHGDNLFSVIQKNKTLKTIIGGIIEEKGYKLTLRQATREIEITRESEGVLTVYPYTVISDTLQRLIFFLAAIETNPEGTTLLFEEPESNVFPYYTKYLSEKIALDTTRQYFISTHNPYFLQSLLQKTPTDELQVNIVTMKSYTTHVTALTRKEEIEELIDLDSNVFLNLDRFTA